MCPHGRKEGGRVRKEGGRVRKEGGRVLHSGYDSMPEDLAEFC